MLRMSLLLVTALSFLAVPTEADAWPRLFRRWRSGGNYYTSNYSYGGGSVYSSPAEAADAKARIQASQCRMYHCSGGFGGGNAEGVGAGMTPAQALNNCCFTGQRPLAASAVYQGSNGMYYACKIFY